MFENPHLLPELIIIQSNCFQPPHFPYTIHNGQLAKQTKLHCDAYSSTAVMLSTSSLSDYSYIFIYATILAQLHLRNLNSTSHCCMRLWS